MIHGLSKDTGWPTIQVCQLVDGEELYKVILDEIAIAECGDLVTAFMLMVATYYVFNVAYPKELKNTLMFMQKAFLNIMDARKNKKVNSLMCKLLAR